MQNTRNYSQKSNFMCGSEELDLLPFYVTSINVPGITFSIPEVNTRNGTMINLSPDVIEFNSLSMELLLDEDYNLYKEVMDLIFKNINVESGTFADNVFQFWCEVTDDLGKSVMKIEYYNCRIESVGDLQLDTTDETTETVFSLELKYDYFKIV